MTMLRNPLSILREAADAEEFEIVDLDLDDIQADLDDTFDQIDDIADDDLDYTEEMVNVIESNSSSGNPMYLVEAENLAKYMKSVNITDVSEAMNNIAEYNSLDKDTMCIVIESEDYFLDIIEEAKKLKKTDITKSKFNDIKSSLDVIKQMKTKGIKVVKRKSKKNKKK